MGKQSMLAWLGAALLATVVLAAPAAAVSDTYANVSFHPFTMDVTNATCVPWTEPGPPVVQTRNCDPVDLVFVGTTVHQVRKTLRLSGWTHPGNGTIQNLHFADQSNFVRQDVQLFFWDGDFSRYHIRLWQVPGTGTQPPVVVGAVHHERTLQNDTVDKSWEAAESFVATQLCRPELATCVSTGVLATQLSIQGGTTLWRGLTNDARATVFTF